MPDAVPPGGGLAARRRRSPACAWGRFTTWKGGSMSEASSSAALAAPTSSALVGPSENMPGILVPGPAVRAADLVEPGTGLWLALGTLAVVVGLAVATLATTGILLVALLVGLIVEWAYSRRVMARIRGSA